MHATTSLPVGNEISPATICAAKSIHSVVTHAGAQTEMIAVAVMIAISPLYQCVGMQPRRVNRMTFFSAGSKLMYAVISVNVLGCTSVVDMTPTAHFVLLASGTMTITDIGELGVSGQAIKIASSSCSRMAHFTTAAAVSPLQP